MKQHIGFQQLMRFLLALSLTLGGTILFAQNDIDDVEMDMDTAISESEAVQKEVEASKERLATEKRKLSETRQKAEKLKNDAVKKETDATNRIVELEKQITATKTETKLARKDIAASNKRIVKADANVKVVTGKLTKAEMDTKSVKEVLKLAQDKEAKIDLELTKLNQEHETRNNNLKELATELATIQESTKTKSAELSEARKKGQKEVADYEKRKGNYERLIEKNKDEAKKNEGEIRKLRGQVSTLKQETETAQAESEIIQKRVADSRERLNLVAQEVAPQKREWEAKRSRELTKKRSLENQETSLEQESSLLADTKVQTSAVGTAGSVKGLKTKKAAKTCTVRSGPSIQAHAIDSVTTGQNIVVRAPASSGFMEIEHHSQKGYVHGSCFKR